MSCTQNVPSLGTILRGFIFTQSSQSLSTLEKDPRNRQKCHCNKPKQARGPPCTEPSVHYKTGKYILFNVTQKDRYSLCTVNKGNAAASPYRAKPLALIALATVRP